MGVERVVGADALEHWVRGDHVDGAVELEAVLSEILVSACRTNRVLPSLAGAIADGFLALSGAPLAVLHEEVEAVLADQIRIERAVLKVALLLDEAGIDHRVLKGVATAHLDWPNPALRQFGDADILIRPSDVTAVVQALLASDLPFLPIRGGDARIQHAFTAVVNGIEVDVHLRLLPQSLGHLLDDEDLFRDPVDFFVAGRRLRALPPELRLLQASIQNVASGQLDTKWSSDFDVMRLRSHVDEMLAVADRHGLGWAARAGLDRAGVSAPGPRSQRRGAMNRLTSWVYGAKDPSPYRSFIAEMIVAPGSVPRLVRGVISPGAEYLDKRDRSRLGHLGHLLRRVPGLRR